MWYEVVLTEKAVHIRISGIYTSVRMFINIRKSSPITGLEWPRGFQEFKVPRFHDNGRGWW
jgi:hypothetical protein